jgi:tRNA threonylcarbamoyladenosine modification (KEOPS) complex Cgi121 subunit
MQFHIDEFNKYVEITGYKNIAFDTVEAFLKTHRKQTLKEVEIQFFDAKLVATEQHLYFAVLNALQAFENKTNISNSIAMETMLYASAQGQIQKSIKRLGIKPETKNMAVTIISSKTEEIQNLLKQLSTCIGSPPDPTTLEITKDKKARIMETFKISNEEIETLTENNSKDPIVDLIIERVALLATQL